jgi:hypothetical protein
MRYNPSRQRRLRTRSLALLALPVLLVFGWLVYQIPAVQARLSWRVELARAYIGGVIHPAGPVPTPLPTQTARALNQAAPTAAVLQPTPSATAQATQANQPTATALPTPTAIPEVVQLASPGFVMQEINNCGPASLAMYLDYYGWEGTQEYDL